jgi:hypothetical protein
MVKKLCFVALFIIIFLSSGCTTPISVKIDASDSLKLDLVNSSSAISTVNIVFMRPALDIDIYFSQNPSEDSINSILDRVKSFSTVDNIKAVAKSVKWDSLISDIYLNIYTVDSNSVPKYKFSASYSYMTDESSGTNTKSPNSTQKLKEIIDEYKTWTKVTLP